MNRPARVALVLLASLLLGACASSGDAEDGLAAYERGDYATAFRYFLPLAEDGDAVAQYVLGGMCLLGQGVPQDYAEAAKWYLRSAEQGDADAQYALAAMRDPRSMSLFGEEITQDYAEAAKWYRRAADQGEPSAQYELGVLYMHGNGVPQDQVQAHAWYAIAARGFSKSQAAKREAVEDLRDELARSMTATQLAEARRLAREWKPKLEVEGD